jgi:ABC-type bacteriocin/lantibiotic exporter with double-glycine peptidase domain
MGLPGIVSESGGHLSGGQWQPLSVTRAIFNKPHIFLFGEATRALNNLARAVVSPSVEALQPTRIVNRSRPRHDPQGSSDRRYGEGRGGAEWLVQ